MIAWVNGSWVEDGAPALSISDRGASLGDGVFETILFDGSRVRRFERHIGRLRRSARALGLPAPPAAAEVEKIIAALLDRNQLTRTRAAIRLTWTAGPGPRGLARPAIMKPSLIAAAAAAPEDAKPLRLVASRIRRSAGALAARHKTLSYLENIAALRGCGEGEEAALFTREDYLAGGARSNLIVVIDGRAVTPPIAHGALPGTVRAALVASQSILNVAAVTRAAADRIEAGAATNALFGLRPIASWDGRPLAVDHPLIARLRAAEPFAP